MTKVSIRSWLVGLALCLPWQLALAVQTIPLYVYYPGPTFAVGMPGNLSEKMAEWLTQRSAGRYQFIATQLPRRRLQLMLSQPQWQGVVAWANPRWFGSEGRRQSWSRYYMVDANMVASLRSAPFEYQDDASLHGQRIGTVEGFSYKDFDALLAAGLVSKDEADSEARNLLKLQQRRVAVAFLQASSMPRMRQQYPDLDSWLYLSERPRTVFERAFFMAPNQPQLLAFLNQQSAALLNDRQWQQEFDTCKHILPRLSGASEAQRKLCR
ncbi:transporter substrate-binding domain-containing protein [Duganella fentianensis]|uniref:transporter substrate-binding domain-containing protein n=1 Tax=Duganella fentianensis TaxID=2692177 RepID=UPI0032B232D4